jgi:dipeptidyl aminopeptidase/acylaminoacyl peptidase
VKCAVRFLRAKAGQFQLDAERIGVWGQSAGGHLAALLGTSGGLKQFEGTGGWQKFSSRVSAVIDWNGPVEFLDPVEQKRLALRKDDAAARLFGSLAQENRKKAVEASPATHATRDDPPFLIMHGDRDEVVSLGQSRLLYEALKKAGVDATLHVVPGAGHFGVTNINALPTVYGEVMDAFFDRHLKR